VKTGRGTCGEGGLTKATGHTQSDPKRRGGQRAEAPPRNPETDGAANKNCGSFATKRGGENTRCVTGTLVHRGKKKRGKNESAGVSTELGIKTTDEGEHLSWTKKTGNRGKTL